MLGLARQGDGDNSAAGARGRQPDAQELVDRWRQGDNEAAQALYDRHVDHVRQVVRYHLNRRFHVRCDEEDAVQAVFLEVFYRLAESSEEFATDDSLRRWVRAVARNRTIKLIKFQSAGRRAISREKRSMDNDDQPRAIDHQSHRPSRKGAHVRLTELKDRIETLDDDSRVIVAMLQEERSQREIAQQLDCTTRTVRRRMQLIRDFLKQSA